VFTASIYNPVFLAASHEHLLEELYNQVTAGLAAFTSACIILPLLERQFIAILFKRNFKKCLSKKNYGLLGCESVKFGRNAEDSVA
jgi:hypothetical protein